MSLFVKAYIPGVNGLGESIVYRVFLVSCLSFIVRDQIIDFQVNGRFLSRISRARTKFRLGNTYIDDGLNLV